jgi:hypothetical protein
MVRGSSHPSVDILVLVPFSIHGTRTRMSTNESWASNHRSSTRSWRGFYRRAVSSTRSHRGFFSWTDSFLDLGRGFSRRAKTCTRTRRVVLSSQLTALIIWIGEALHFSSSLLLSEESPAAPGCPAEIRTLTADRLAKQRDTPHPNEICNISFSCFCTVFTFFRGQRSTGTM